MNSCVQSSQYNNIANSQAETFSCFYNNGSLSADITNVLHSDDTHLSNISSTNWYQSFQTSASFPSQTANLQVNNTEEMSFSQQQIISKQTLNTQIQQSFSHFDQCSEEHWTNTLKCQYPLLSHQLTTSNLSTYLSASNVYLNTNQVAQNINQTAQNIKREVITESPVLIENNFQNLNAAQKELVEINKKQRSLLKRNDKFDRNILKRKRNSYLRIKIMSPKNALNLLKEVYPQLKIKVTKELCETQELYTSEVNIDGYEFKATDLTKDKTNEKACEEALKTIFLKKGFDSPLNNTEDGIERIDPSPPSESSVSKIKEENYSWSLLTRYAIFKLFSEWEKQGFHAPKLSEVEFVPDIIPRKHPVQLLHEIRPHWKFIEEKEGTSPNFRFRASIFTDDQIFTGTGRSKKLARKVCAEKVLKVFGVQYLWG